MLIDTRYLMYKIINFWFVRKIGLERINIFIKKLVEIEKKEKKISEIVKVEIDIDGYL